MKLRLLLFSLLTISVLNAVMATPPAYKTIPDGLIIFTDSLVTGTSNAVRLEVIAADIIRVTAAPAKEIMPVQSLVTVYKKRSDVFWEVIPSKGTLTLRTKKLSAVVDLKTGAVSFRDGKGVKILDEKQTLGRSFQPSIVEGKRCYELVQTFQTAPGDAWYGLGQHQDGIYNYRGRQESPFL